MDGFGTPQDILSTQTSNQRSHFLADGWTAPFPSRFPAPPLEKSMLMPLEHGPWVSSVRPRISIRSTPWTATPTGGETPG
jgi:hypothetical protein